MKRYRTINVTLRQWLTCPGQYQLIQTQSNVCVCMWKKSKKRKVAEIMIIIMGYIGAGFMCISVRKSVLKQRKECVYWRKTRERIYPHKNTCTYITLLYYFKIHIFY